MQFSDICKSVFVDYKALCLSLVASPNSAHNIFLVGKFGLDLIH